MQQPNTNCTYLCVTSHQYTSRHRHTREQFSHLRTMQQYPLMYSYIFLPLFLLISIELITFSGLTFLGEIILKGEKVSNNSHVVTS